MIAQGLSFMVVNFERVMIMKNWFPLNWLVLVCMLVSVFPANAEEEAAGTVKIARGSVQVERKTEKLKLSVGDKLYPSDRIFTGKFSSVGIMLKDNTRISMGPSSSFKINQFTYNPNDRKGSFVGSILKGSFRFITGLMGKQSPQSVSLRTPSSTIGIRGTDFIVNVEDSGEEAPANVATPSDVVVPAEVVNPAEVVTPAEVVNPAEVVTPADGAKQTDGAVHAN
jgi:hypothetical protein